MDNRTEANRQFLLMAILALWAGAFGYSIYYAMTVPAEGDGFTRGLNRITGFLGWQGVAGMVAFAVWGVGRGFPIGSGMRRVSRLPIALTLLLVAGMTALVVWARFTPA